MAQHDRVTRAAAEVGHWPCLKAMCRGEPPTAPNKAGLDLGVDLTSEFDLFFASKIDVPRKCSISGSSGRVPAANFAITFHGLKLIW